MKVFIASSTEAIDTARKIASWLEKENLEPRVWDDEGVFHVGERDKVGYIGWAEVRSPSIADGGHLKSNHSITVVNRDRWASFVSPSYN